MQSEQDWLNRADEGETYGAAERYKYFMRPEPRDDLGPIEEIDDPILGRTKVREMKVGMVRNAKAENKKSVLAYLQPFPHTRISKAKELQGWYKSLHEPDGIRPRPCFTEAVLTEPYGGFCSVGCAFSLPAGEPVSTPDGSLPIESIKVGQVVWGRSTDGRVSTRVVGTSRHYKPEGLVELLLSDGRRLRMTADHPVYSADRKTWVEAGDLRRGENLEDEALPGLRSADSDETYHMRRLRDAGESGERKDVRGQTVIVEGKAEVRGDESEDVGLRQSEPGVYVGEGQGSEVGGVQVGESGGRAKRSIRVSSLQAVGVHGPEGEDVSHAIGLGSPSGQVDGREGDGLGVRTLLYQPTGRVGVSAGLCTTLRRDTGGEGLQVSRVRPEDQVGESDRPPSHDSGRTEAQTGRNPYVRGIERIPGGVEVFDIETETGNFYQRGILVHNCYVNSGFRGYRGTGLITVPEDYGGQIRRQLSTMKRAAAGYFSSFTDPFLPLEEYYHNTESAAEAFVDAGLPIFFLSRLRYPEWAVELLTRSPYSYAQKSINTPDPDDWRRLSPGALPLEQHYRDIERLKKRGIYVSIQVNPVVPGVTSHEDVVKLFRALAEAGADHVIVKFVEAGYSWAGTMTERMIKRFGDRGRVFADLFTENIGGQRTIREDYRLRGHKLYSSYARRFGMTYATCYEYRYRRGADGQILDKTGVSIGREFTTADQCHGHRVPVFARSSADLPFSPLEECPPSGCLYCASENEGTPRCGDDLAGQAKALRLVDLKTKLTPKNP